MFRVVADQLKLRGGLVRCGSCRHVFDAIASLNYVDEDAPGTLVLAEPPLAVSASATGAAAPAAPPAEPPAAAKAAVPAAAPPALPTPAPAPVATTASTAKQSGSGRSGREKSAAAAAGSLDGGVPTLLFVGPDAGDPDEKSDRAARDTPDAAAAGPEAQSAAEPRRSRRHRKRDDATAADAPAVAGSAPAAEPSFLREAREPRGFSIVYTLGAALLGAGLLVQLAIMFRTDLVTRYPALRPTLVQLCQVAGCTVGWPTRAELLAVVGTELQAIAGTDLLELTAVVRNRAGFRVALPAVEVTLTDTQSRAVARKVFAPVDYLASAGEPSSRIDEGLGAGSDFTVRITFEARGLNASGFVVYPFYL
jgi:predicted Zn finger-like uncharacterized protein